MPQVVEHTIYKFDELSDDAKERAREWFKKYVFSDNNDWGDHILDDAACMASILGIELNQKSDDPCIWFSGFYSQGDGACFEGSYSYAKGAAKAIRKETGGTEHKLIEIADRLQAIQRVHFYKLTASVVHTGRYCHEMATDIDVEAEDYDVSEDVADEVRDCLRDFMRWIYGQLKAEYEYQLSDESVDESIKCNEYTFDEDGNREGWLK